VNDSELSNVADQLFKAFEKHDADTLRELCDPEARFWSNATNAELSLDELLAYLPMMRKTIGAHHYDDVRRLVAPDGFVEQHAVRSIRPDGEPLDLQACVVVRTDEEGKIVRLDEYVAGRVDL
jgi:ketosteroid isomerase-like protein